MQHNFTRFSTNWGFNRLTLRSVLLDPEGGWLDRAGSLLLRVDVLQVGWDGGGSLGGTGLDTAPWH